MPRAKKQPAEWTKEEAMKHLFPKKVREELHRVAHEKDKSEAESSSHDNDTKEST
ncbi:MAG: hypothetical protein HQ475_03505 [SAR202 cluster bacterium]|nr:hypothetical protein [SAR202 cluster bacterium]